MFRLNYEDLLGVEFKLNGRDPNDGLDCYGLCMEIYKRMGLRLPEFSYAFQESLLHKQIEEGSRKFVEIADPEPGCLVTFAIMPPYTSHIGVVVDGSRFIHIMKKTRVALERLDASEWRKRITGYYRWKTQRP
ncbi:MAG: NlpC/P60 family protein [Deltaproteobacteria bacterium]